MELLSPRGAQLAILELKIRERGLGAYSEVVGEAKKMCRITGFSSRLFKLYANKNHCKKQPLGCR